MPSDAASSAFADVSKAQEAGHTLAVAPDGTPFSRCHNRKICCNELGELGRGGDPSKLLPIHLESSDGSGSVIKAAHAYAGGFPSSGHSALLDTNANLWMCGCDRWQQLGLGSSAGGSSGYTWKGGRLWQDRFQRNDHVVELLRSLDPSLGNVGEVSKSLQSTDDSKKWIRDIALGGDHTVILSSNKRDVVTFGKGGEGQLGLSSKPWVSAPAKAKALSSSKADISAVCAYRNCSMTLNESGDILNKVGKCSMEAKGMQKALERCRKRAKESGLINASL